MNRLLGGFSDGNGEAGHDLLPGSAYLTDLNSRPHPQGVAITAVVGRMAPAELPVPDASAWPLVSNWVTPEHVDAARGAAEDVADDLGDGVVPVESARLEGIRDIVEIEGNHRGMVRRIEALETVRELVGGVSGEPPAIAIVLDRLARPVEAADVAPAE